MKRLSNLDMAQNEIQNVRIQNLASAPSSPVEGQMYYNTTSDTPFIYANGAWLDMGVQGGSGATDLGATLSASNVIVTSNTGADATIPAVDGTNAGVMTPTQKTKLDGIATGATANSTDATLLARANHTGTQTASTISDFSSAADARISAAAGVSVASLSGGKVPTSQLPAIAIVDVNSVASQAAQLALTAQEGDVAIRTDLSKTYIHNGGVAGTMADWSELATPTDTVTSVNSQTGAVVLTKSDVGLSNVDNTSDANKPVSTATQTALNAKTTKYTATVGGSTSITVTHNLGSSDVITQVRQASDNAVVECDITNATTNTVTLGFATAPTASSLKVVVIG